MPDLNYPNYRPQQNIEYRASFNVPDSTQPVNSYIQNQHLSTPPAHHRSRNVSLGDGR